MGNWSFRERDRIVICFEIYGLLATVHCVIMTYKLNPELRKILSPIVLIFPDGTKQQYESGKAAADDVFDHKYLISTLRL